MKTLETCTLICTSILDRWIDQVIVGVAKISDYLEMEAFDNVAGGSQSIL